MGVAVFVLCVLYVAVKWFKDKIDDAYLRERARQNGIDLYVSSTGIRYVDDDSRLYDPKNRNR